VSSRGSSVFLLRSPLIDGADDAVVGRFEGKTFPAVIVSMDDGWREVFRRVRETGAPETFPVSMSVGDLELPPGEFTVINSDRLIGSLTAGEEEKGRA
jgi:hypothetical protein